jgi:hypothetical protein
MTAPRHSGFLWIKVLGFLLLATIASVAQGPSSPSKPDDTPLRTHGFMNGRGWRTLNGNEKLICLSAFRDGLAWGYGIGQGKGSQSTPTPSLNLSGMFPERLTWAETSSALDRFYDTPENGPIFLPGALQIVTMKAVGVDESVIEEHLQQLRRN